MSVWHWAIMFAFFSIGVPIGKILEKAGFNKWWAVVFFIPLINIVALWAFSLADWPNTTASRMAGRE
jgi:hypothetical protein